MCTRARETRRRNTNQTVRRVIGSGTMSKAEPRLRIQRWFDSEMSVSPGNVAVLDPLTQDLRPGPNGILRQNSNCSSSLAATLSHQRKNLDQTNLVEAHVQIGAYPPTQ